ncbi:MAG: foldase protein PrsA [Sphaerochaetaceae bacterium]|jgi:peptidyl-prolyl cis-trans isomerase SurA
MSYRKVLSILLIVVALSPIALFSADIVAKVNLIRLTEITEQELNDALVQYRAEAQAAGSLEEIKPQDILSILINDELVLQGAERDGYAITESQVNQLVRQQKAYVEQQLGTEISDAQFETIIKNNYGLDLASFKQSLKESALVDQYVRGKMRSEIEDFDGPTDAQINEFFRANRSSFMNPELIRLSHIFIPFKDNDKAEIKKEMDQLARWLRYGTYTFEELVPRYSQDKESVKKGGDIGWLAYDDDSMRSYLGAKFFEDVFSLQLGKPSGVLESNGGYHIVKVTIHTEPKLLSLTDTINPESSTTVRQYIIQTLTNRNQQVAYLRAIEKLVKQLQESAKIEILLKD